MDPTDIAFIKGVVAFALVAGTCLGSFRIWLRYRSLAPGPTEAQLADIRDEQMQVQATLEARLVELEERLDFTERRLTQERSGRSLPELPAHTPV